MVFEHRIVPGPSDRSYGIHVARLAGLPPAVVSRAEHLLTEMEAEAPERRRPARASSAPEHGGSALQPSLFVTQPSLVEEALKAIDPDGLTPMEAIQKLYELRALLNGKLSP